MVSTFPWFVCVLVSVDPAELETKFAQVGPSLKAEALVRSPGQARAVILIHGLLAHPFSGNNVRKPRLHDWQRPQSLLVESLSKHADVFAFAYGQNLAVEQVAEAPQLADAVERVRKLGYADIVLLGHSAGGLIARHFVEDRRDTGVTKVIQVCCPNGGSDLARTYQSGVRKEQRPFLQSLTREGRTACLLRRAEKHVPETVEFVCLVGTGHKNSKGEVGDGLVLCGCQWTEDLQKQGVPVRILPKGHWVAVRNQDCINQLITATREKHARWNSDRIEQGKNMILGLEARPVRTLPSSGPPTPRGR